MIKITADSTCDLSPELLKRWNITLTPLHILAGNQTFRDGVDITPPDIFRYVEQEGKMCRTAAVNIAEYKALFEEMSEKYDAVIHICISSFFSSCYQNACLAAAEFPNVHVIDSLNLSTGSGHLVCDAAEMAEAGMEPQEICTRLKEIVPKIDASFVIDRLDYLHKGGRCSGLAAQGAKLLQIKPCIEVTGGKMQVGKKYRGTFIHCLEQYVKDRLTQSEAIDDRRVFITHPLCSGEAVAAVRAALARYSSFREIIETHAGCTVSCHCGPDTLGILYQRK